MEANDNFNLRSMVGRFIQETLNTATHGPHSFRDFAMSRTPGAKLAEFMLGTTKHYYKHKYFSCGPLAFRDCFKSFSHYNPNGANDPCCIPIQTTEALLVGRDLCRGPLDIAIYQIYNLFPLGFRYFKVFPA